MDEVLARLELRDVTLVQNDWGGAQILPAQGGGERIGRLVLTSSEAYEAFDNYPPRIARFLVPLAKVPGGLAVLAQLLRLRPVRRAPRGWGWMSKRPVPKDVVLDGYEILMDGAARIADLDPGRAAAMLVDALRAASYGGDVARVVAAGRRAQLLPGGADGSPAVAFVAGIGAALGGDTTGSVPHLRLDGRPDVSLREGDLFAVPRGVVHQPVARAECHLMLLEPGNVVNTGGSGPRSRHGTSGSDPRPPARGR